LRKLVENARTALAIPCYADDARGVQALIDEELGTAGLTIQGEARQRLAQLLGGDRLASRNELKKLALYCHGSGTVTDADVIEAMGDVAALSVDDAVEAVFSGDPVRLEAALERILASKTSVFWCCEAASCSSNSSTPCDRWSKTTDAPAGSGHGREGPWYSL
jgi:DNA polymerase-3 subunit delta